METSGRTKPATAAWIRSRNARIYGINLHLQNRDQEPRGHGKEGVLGSSQTDGGRSVTLVIEQTVEPTSWLTITGWGSSDAERKLLENQS